MKKEVKPTQTKAQGKNLEHLVIYKHSSVKEKNEVKKMIAYMFQKWEESKTMN